MTPYSWIVMPVIDCLDYTLAALDDCLAQAIEPPTRVLLIDNGSARETRRNLEERQFSSDNRVLCWWHHPALGNPPAGTVNASWNRGLDFCWACGAEEVLVVNNDVRLQTLTYPILQRVLLQLDALFVSAVGVTQEQFEEVDKIVQWWSGQWNGEQVGRGGPDFSCFLISKECHERFRFDEQFTYFGDNDYHRRLQLAGEGKRIFSVNLPYLHYGSATVNRSEAAKTASHAVFEDHCKRYLAKWGGMPHHEKFEVPYAEKSEAHL